VGIVILLIHSLRSLRLCENRFFILLKDALAVSVTASPNNGKLFSGCHLIPDFAALLTVRPYSLAFEPDRSVVRQQLITLQLLLQESLRRRRLVRQQNFSGGVVENCAGNFSRLLPRKRA